LSVDQDEGLHPLAHRGLAHRQGAEGIGLHRLLHLALHHGHVLVGGGVEDQVRARLRHQPVHLRRVAHVQDRGAQPDVGEFPQQLLFQLEEPGFADVRGDDLLQWKAR